MKHKSRRYNAANETNKEFYIRRTNEMKKVIESEQWEENDKEVVERIQRRK